jgi:DNA polymerase-3 subunit epsilon
VRLARTSASWHLSRRGLSITRKSPVRRIAPSLIIRNDLRYWTMNHIARHVVIDVETAQSYDHIIEIAAVEVIGRTISPRSLVRRVKPRSAMSPFCYAVHHISLADLEQEPYFEHVIHDLIDFVGDDTIVAHNYAYEYNTLKREFARAERPAYPRERFFCTMALAKRSGLPGKLRHACGQVGISIAHLRDAHDALNDALLAAHLFLKLTPAQRP